MNVLLIKPSWKYPITAKENTYNRVWPPLELLNCAAILERQGHQVQLVDCHAEKLAPSGLARRVVPADLAILTTSSLDRWQCPNLELTPIEAYARALRPLADQLVLTGFHGTVEPEALLRQTQADIAILGEPEEVVCEWGQGKALADVQGIAFLRDEQLISRPERAKVDLARLPTPALQLVDLRKYRYEILGGRFALLEASRGCPYPCTFCSRVMQGRPVRRKTPEQVGGEVQAAIDAGARSLYFIDLEFTAVRPLVEGICQYLLDHRLTIRWCCQTRTDQVDEPLLKLMKRAGCRLIHFGVETGSARIAEQVQKRVTLEQQRAGVELARRVGLDVLCFFLLGHPGETVEEMEQTIRFAQTLNPTYASFHRVSPYHGTPLYDAVGSNRDSERFSAYAVDDESRQCVDRLVRQALWRFYARPSYIASRVLRGEIGSWGRQLRLFAGYFRG